MLLSLLILAAATPAPQSADPLAPARSGQYQCVVPNQEKKTCLGTTSYKVSGDSYESTTQLFLAPTPLVTMEIHTTGVVKNGQVCETVKLSDFQAGTVFLNGQPADAATSEAVKSQMTAAVSALDGKAACSAIKPDADGLLLNEVSIDGTVRADLSQKFVWVSAKDGYKLGM
ncbi:hypothetical protein P6144_04965 [Sphingomonas sp. HITSZ_GF]|uniref:hypothetical protein n=1 Tax=Sphingomonas sp. HITSZ_GF TaxID=3037247 RepID=UPI00240DF323|nr:hypothetical protein [Sphingomonas sp. HITSZ_GF]MDG2532987.1 hypothetical protein [Sphingomonas sp. HITSZ_GF]